MRRILLLLLVLAALAPVYGGLSAANAAGPALEPAKVGEAAAHPYAGLDPKSFWQAVERDRRSPTEMPGVTGSFEHPSPHGPKRTGSEVSPAHAPGLHSTSPKCTAQRPGVDSSRTSSC